MIVVNTMNDKNHPIVARILSNNRPSTRPSNPKLDRAVVQKLWLKEKEALPDTIFLVKFGAFAEAYHEDAQILVKETECMYMQSSLEIFTRHTGFPWSVVDKYVTLLESKGYKVKKLKHN